MDPAVLRPVAGGVPSESVGSGFGRIKNDLVINPLARTVWIDEDVALFEDFLLLGLDHRGGPTLEGSDEDLEGRRGSVAPTEGLDVFHPASLWTIL